MSWVPSVDYVEATPMKRRGTKKKVWDESTNAWKDVTIWTVDANKQLRTWLEEFYPDREGWSFVWTDAKIVMEERVYIHYCLKFG